MPIYTYQCSICDDITDEYRSIDERNSPLECGCGHVMELKIMPVNLNPVLGGGDFPGYQCPVTDQFVTSRKQRKEIMAEHNLVDVGDRGSTRGKQASGL